MNMNDVTRFINLAGQKIYKNRSNIAFVSGTLMTMVGTGLFVKKSFKFSKRVDEHKVLMDEIKAKEAESGENLKKEKHDICKETIKEGVKCYAGAATLSAVGYGLQFYAHSEDRSDLGVMSVALNASVAAYEGIKEKIIAKDGVEKWNEYAYEDSLEKTVEIDKETGEVLREDTIQKAPFRDMFAEFFDSSNPHYKEFQGANKSFIIFVEDWANGELERKGFLKYHDVLVELGMKDLSYLREETSKAGWVYDPSKVRQVSFGLEYGIDTAMNRFLDEEEYTALLRFNCVPNIYHYI